jgi:hypothetical protein
VVRAFGFAVGGEYTWGNYNGSAPAGAALAKGLDGSKHWVLSGTYTIGALGLGVMYGSGTQDNGANVEDRTQTYLGIGAQYVLAPGMTAADLLEAAFPPGSVTGAPKVQAMKSIARLEPPRGPYCGALFWAGFDGAFDSSVLIRTLGLVEDDDGWRFEARAGAGIVADSDPRAERLETEAKIAALLRALTTE